jgi:hypothetical protein
MRYDAFISYAREDREDEEWVLQVGPGTFHM